MNVSTMRRIDRWVGVPVCVALTGLRRCRDLLRAVRRAKPPAVGRILFVKPAEQGATVLAYPAILKAVEMVGRENVFFLVFEENRFILDVMDVIPERNIVTIPTRRAWKMAAGTLRALRRIKSLRPDAAIDLEFFARSSAALAYLSGASWRVGLHARGGEGPYRGDLMTHRLRYDPNQHTTEAFASMVEALGAGRSGEGDSPIFPAGKLGLSPSCSQSPSCSGPEQRPAFTPGEEELAQVRATVEREAGTSDLAPLALLNANASDLMPLRRWPAERYVELARRLIAWSPRLRVAFTGSPDEAAASEKLAAAVESKRCFSLAGKTTLRQLLSVYCLADLLVTNDSGPAHFATLTPIRVVTLFGPETPARFGSRSPRTHIVWKNPACSPCVTAINNRLSTCRDNQCMKKITVDEVFQVVTGVLGPASVTG